MADVVVEKHDRFVFGSINGWYRIVLIGAALGLVAFILTWVIGTYIIEPLVCRGSSLRGCSDSGALAGNISGVVAAIAGLVVLIRSRVRRSLLVVIASLVALWNIQIALVDFSAIETLVWMVGLYAVLYILLVSIFRFRSIYVAIALAAIAVIAFRWIVFL